MTHPGHGRRIHAVQQLVQAPIAAADKHAALGCASSAQHVDTVGGVLQAERHDAHPPRVVKREANNDDLHNRRKSARVCVCVCARARVCVCAGVRVRADACVLERETLPQKQWKGRLIPARVRVRTCVWLRVRVVARACVRV